MKTSSAPRIMARMRRNSIISIVSGVESDGPQVQLF